MSGHVRERESAKIPGPCFMILFRILTGQNHPPHLIYLCSLYTLSICVPDAASHLGGNGASQPQSAEEPFSAETRNQLYNQISKVRRGKYSRAARKNAGCPVKFEFQINHELFLF